MNIMLIARTCFQLLCLVGSLLLASHVFAMPPPATPEPPSEKNSSSTTRQATSLPILMVNIQNQSSHAASANDHAFTPYQGALARNPYLSWIIMLCACLLPLGMLVVTVATVIDFRKNRSDDETLTFIELTA